MPPRPRKFTREEEVGAVADWLLGKTIADIEFKWKMTQGTFMYHIRQSGHFKMPRDYGDLTKRRFGFDSCP